MDYFDTGGMQQPQYNYPYMPMQQASPYPYMPAPQPTPYMAAPQPYSYMPVQGYPMLPSGMPGTAMPTQSFQTCNPQEALSLIRRAVEGEREDEIFYDFLIREAPSQEDKAIIEGIRNDERKHFRMFRQLYQELTGQMLPPPKEVQFEKPANFLAGVEKALQGETGAVVKYRKILFCLQDRNQINMLTEIITDEIRHGILYSLVYSRNK